MRGPLGGNTLETTLFYTFSTIAQTLAGAIALLGAFVLYRLQNLAHELEDASLAIVNCYREPLRDQVAPLHHGEAYEDILGFTRDHAFDDPSAKAPYVASRVARLPHLLAKRRGIKLWLRISLILTVVMIAGSVAVLALVPRIVLHVGLPQCLLVIGWGGLVVTFAAYWLLIRHTLA